MLWKSQDSSYTCRDLEPLECDCSMSTLSASWVALAVPNMEAVVNSDASFSYIHIQYKPTAISQRYSATTAIL